MLSYVVRMDFDDPSVLAEMRAWLEDPHVADVLAAGAVAAELVVLDGALALEVRYRFASREAFADYERDHAARLRAEGVARLAGRPARFTRSTGEITGAWPSNA